MIGATHHREVHLEDYVADKLVAAGWLEGDPARYDRHLALYPEDVIGWVQESQPAAWEKLSRAYGADAEKQLLSRLEKALSSKDAGTVKVIRDGISIAGCGRILMSQRAPEDEINPDLTARYRANRLRLVRQLKYNPTREWAIDIVLFINGIPTATIELKTDFTQSIDDAIAQYKNDRMPSYKLEGRNRPEPLLTFRRGAVVHFAMSDSEIAMTTKLNGQDTVFLPFNRGHNDHAGNPPRDDGEYPVAYFWEEVCTWENWLRIFHDFVYLEKGKVQQGRAQKASEKLVFPRFHQLDAVNKMVADVRKNGVGQQYLNEHSAGSGKTSTIVWTAHDLIRIRHSDGTPYFNSVIIVSDRNVLDQQLQDAVQQIDHQFGVIEVIDSRRYGQSKSDRLAEVLRKGAPIIVVTVQTFPHAIESIITNDTLRDRNFAVIIDEAHSSQTGTSAHGLRAALAMDSAEQMERMTTEEFLLEVQRSRFKPSNVSYFAFTATPKHETFELFGRLRDPSQPSSRSNLPVAFHRYTQRQAIEEGFILDVLQNYIPYDEAFQLGERWVNHKRVDRKLARKALARLKELHPTVVSQKVEFIVDHFTKNVAQLLDGEAKAMVVTSGRPQAVKYKLAFDKYIKTRKLEGIEALVAFSGKVNGSSLGEDSEEDPLGIDFEADYTEVSMNPGIGGRNLRAAFEDAQYNVMIVANKFQTGFNQPKLVAMYIDKKLQGIEAVQTLSRLNRVYPGKSETWVIDFVNDPQTILDAFKTYDRGASLVNAQDPNVVYDIKDRLDAAGIYHFDDIEKFREACAEANISSNVHKKLHAATDAPARRYNEEIKRISVQLANLQRESARAQEMGDEEAVKHFEGLIREQKEERSSLTKFKSGLSQFVRAYNYVAQIVYLDDAELESFASFAKLLSRRLDGVPKEQIDLSGILLTDYRLRRGSTNDVEGTAKDLRPKSGESKDIPISERELLGEIVKRINAIFGDISDDEGRKHFTEQIIDIVKKDAVITDRVLNNNKENAIEGGLSDIVNHAVVKAMTSHNELARTLLKDPDSMSAYISIIYDIIKKQGGVGVNR